MRLLRINIILAMILALSSGIYAQENAAENEVRTIEEDGIIFEIKGEDTYPKDFWQEENAIKPGFSILCVQHINTNYVPKKNYSKNAHTSIDQIASYETIEYGSISKLNTGELVYFPEIQKDKLAQKLFSKQQLEFMQQRVYPGCIFRTSISRDNHRFTIFAVSEQDAINFIKYARHKVIAKDNALREEKQKLLKSEQDELQELEKELDKLEQLYKEKAAAKQE